MRHAPCEPPFPHIGIGQDDDWVRANFTNATDILAVGCADWVDAQVGVDLEDDVACGTVAVLQSEDGVLALVGIDGFVGDVYEETATGFACVSAGANWRISSTDPDRET